MGLQLRRFFTTGSWSDLRSRVISAIVLAVAVFLLAFLGGWPFRLLCLAIGIVVFDEWARITRAKRAGPIYGFARRVLIIALVAFVFGFSKVALGIVAGGMAFIAFVDRGERKADWVVGGLFYAALAALPPGMVRGDDVVGLVALGFVVAVVWSTDIFAYFVGRSIGGPKLMPIVSPKKTLSGALGGLVAGMIFGAAFAYWAVGRFDGLIILMAAALSVLGQAGDLYESWIKRRFGVKDSGRLIPGHGGLMDRIDALIIATGALWIVGAMLGGIENPAAAIF